MYKLVACDTDSIKFCRIDGKPMSKDEQDAVLARMNSKTPDLIRLEEDGYYKKFLVVKSKNYVTFDGKKTKYKGSGIVDQKKEPMLREFLNELIATIMDNPGNYNHLIEPIYTKYCLKALQITDINQWAVKKTVTKSVLTESTPASANINAAIKGKNFSEGDKIWLFVTDHPDKPEEVNKKKFNLIDEFSGEYHKWHYVSRVYKTLCILEKLIDIKSFIKYHNKMQRSKLEGLLNESEEKLRRAD